MLFYHQKIMVFQKKNQHIKILLIGLFGKFMGTARLPASLKKAGAEVNILSTHNSFLSATRHVDKLTTVSENKGRLWRYRYTIAIIAMLMEHPDLIVAMDETSLQWLQSLRTRYGKFLGIISPSALNVLNRSLPASQQFLPATTRFYNHQLAEKLGIRHPAAKQILTSTELDNFIMCTGLPIVLKAEHTTAGTGIRICHTKLEAEEHRKSLLTSSRGHHLLAQHYITGIPAMHSFSALNGHRVDGISALKLTCHPSPNGPSSTIQIIDNKEMVWAATKMAEAMSISGYASLDFIVEHKTGHAYLIEFNPRPTPIHHLSTLSANLLNALGGTSIYPKSIPNQTKIALYPQEWIRRGGEINDHDLIPDVLTDDPELNELYKKIWENK